MSSSSDGHIQIRPRVLRRFYEPLLLLSAIDQIRGVRTKPDIDSEFLTANHRKLRRSFADGIAYISSYCKGPDQVTAAAIERSSDGFIIWLAANGGVDGKVVEFLYSVLGDILSILSDDDIDHHERQHTRLLGQILTQIINFNRPRLEAYYQLISSYASGCLPAIEEAAIRAHLDETSLSAMLVQTQEWLTRKFLVTAHTAVSMVDLQSLVRECHQQRTKEIFEVLKSLSAQGKTRCREFELLHKLLCKFGKHVTVARKLVEAAATLRQDLGGTFVIEVVPNSRLQSLPLTKNETTLENIAGRMFSTLDEKDRFLNRLRSVLSQDELKRVLTEKKAKQTRVHAELLLLDHLHRRRCTFVDDSDKYIGCSKPACYLCHAYIKEHPGRFALPASHQKLYVGWRLPDVNPGDAASYRQMQIQEEILGKLTDLVRNDLNVEMESREPRRPYHPDSTAGVSSTPDGRLLDCTLDLASMNLDDEKTVGSAHSTEEVGQSIDSTTVYSRQTASLNEVTSEEWENDDNDGGVPLF